MNISNEEIEAFAAAMTDLVKSCNESSLHEIPFLKEMDLEIEIDLEAEYNQYLEDMEDEYNQYLIDLEAEYNKYLEDLNSSPNNLGKKA
jgi:hypothetical protein